ncbi:MAG: hypothetical protein M3O35_01955, partial [Acidobacteriota bacterium]|nr:hypothetical protein [Acidobacteriota bacterium]
MHPSISEYCALALAASSAFAQAPLAKLTFSLQDTTGLVSRPNVKTEAVTYQGRKAVRLTTEAVDGDGLVLLAGTEFQDGVIEADVAMKPMTPPGVRFPGFIGIAFRTRSDASGYELFYLRPGNGIAKDQAMHNHCVQYSAQPGFGWYPLRREWPWVYESAADIEPETWINLRIEVAGRSARLYLNGSQKPILMVDGLKGEDLRGGVALWGYSGEEAYFSNLRITPAAAQPIKNGSDVAGTWEVRGGGDAGPLAGVMKLSREGNKVTGSWSGGLGEGRPVSGTWRNGYIELSFPGEWPSQAGQGAPGP